MATEQGLAPRFVPRGLEVVVRGRLRIVLWPLPDVPKDSFAGLRLRPPAHAVSTELLSRTAADTAPLPGCVKPVVGALGRGFRIYRSRTAFLRLKQTLRSGYVVQPLLEGGREYRVTVCRNGAYAVAEMAGRRVVGDRTARFSRELLAELLSLVRDMRVPGAGFDIMHVGTRYYVLDVNLSPSLTLHRETVPGRDIVPAYLASALEIAPVRRRSVTRPSRDRGARRA